MFQGSRPNTERSTPTRIESRISLPSTASGEPPRKRESEPPAILFSESECAILTRSCSDICHLAGRCTPLFDPLQHTFQGLEAISFARRLVPTQPADAGKP